MQNPKSFGATLKSESSQVREQAATVKVVRHEKPINMPLEFDGREVWKGFLSPIKDQGVCGACSSFSSTSSLNDRYGIWTQGKIKVDLSSFPVVVCTADRDLAAMLSFGKETLSQLYMSENLLHETSACNGESLYNIANYLFRFGTTTTDCCSGETYKTFCSSEEALSSEYKCENVQELEVKDVPPCSLLLGIDQDVCFDGYTAVRRYRSLVYYNVPKDPICIKTEIYKYGPVTSGFIVYADFLTWNGQGIYWYDKKAAKQGAHAVSIIGFGPNYWIIRNSWGESWGDKGFFKLGINQGLELEDNVIAQIPDFDGICLACIGSPFATLQTETDDVIRQQFNVDPSNALRFVSVGKIIEGKLDGTLKYIVEVGQDVPDLTKFTAGDKKTWKYKMVTNAKRLGLKQIIDDFYKTSPEIPYAKEEVELQKTQIKAKQTTTGKTNTLNAVIVVVGCFIMIVLILILVLIIKKKFT